MSGPDDERAESEILEALKAGPQDVLGLLGALRLQIPHLIGQHEGAVHPLLHRMLRGRRIAEAGPSEAGLALYAVPPVEVGTTALETEGPPPLPRPIADGALKIALGVRKPAARGRVRADVAAHLMELAEAGTPERFGAQRAIRGLLHRVDRGRQAVCLADGAGGALRRLVVHEGPWLLGAVVAFFVIKIFIVQPYVIPSESMVPTLLVGDRVAVFKFNQGEAPPRFSVVTYLRGKTTYVKRLIGLGGETIAILHGDVYIDDKILVKPPVVREALRSHVESWDLSADAPRGWQRSSSHDEHTWTFERGALRANPSVLSSFALRDGYLTLDVDRAARGGVLLTLRRGAGPGPGEESAMEWTLEVGERGISLSEARVAKGAALPGTAPTELATDEEALPPGPLTLTLAYVDGVLHAGCAGFSYEQPRPAPDGPLSWRLATRGPPTRLGTFVLDKDLHYSDEGEHGTVQGRRQEANPHPIPPGHLYFLGDNTTNSHDCRFTDVGDIPAAQVIGPVHVRIWPLSRIGSVR